VSRLEQRGTLERVERVIYYAARGLGGHRRPYLLEFTEVERAGAAQEPGWWAQQVNDGRSTDVGIACPRPRARPASRSW
jgi:hypothetical protein